jgi:hypothetical protein
MDTEHFVLDSARISERLAARRSVTLSSYPSHAMERFGVQVPLWAKLALSFATRGGALSRLLEIGIPLAAPFLFRRQMPFLERLVHRIFSAKS